MRRHVLTGNSDAHDWQRFTTEIFAKQKVFKISDSERLSVMRIFRFKIVFGASRMHCPTVPIVFSALDLPDRIFPKISVIKTVSFHHATAAFSGMSEKQSTCTFPAFASRNTKSALSALCLHLSTNAYLCHFPSAFSLNCFSTIGAPFTYTPTAAFSL